MNIKYNNYTLNIVLLNLLFNSKFRELKEDWSNS